MPPVFYGIKQKQAISIDTTPSIQLLNSQSSTPILTQSLTVSDSVYISEKKNQQSQDPLFLIIPIAAIILYIFMNN